MGIIAGRSRQASGPVKQVPPGLGSLLGVPMGLVLVLAGGLLGMGLSALVIVPSGSLGQGEIPVGALLLLILLAVGLTLGATLLTALGAAREKPLNVLRYE